MVNMLYFQQFETHIQQRPKSRKGESMRIVNWFFYMIDGLSIVKADRRQRQWGVVVCTVGWLLVLSEPVNDEVAISQMITLATTGFSLVGLGWLINRFPNRLRMRAYRQGYCGYAISTRRFTPRRWREV